MADAEIPIHHSEAARSAAGWICSFYPDVVISLDERHVRLSSSEHDEAELRLIWLTGLANERLLSRGAARRALVIQELVR